MSGSVPCKTARALISSDRRTRPGWVTSPRAATCRSRTPAMGRTCDNADSTRNPAPTAARSRSATPPSLKVTIPGPCPWPANRALRHRRRRVPAAQAVTRRSLAKPGQDVAARRSPRRSSVRVRRSIGQRVTSSRGGPRAGAAQGCLRRNPCRVGLALAPCDRSSERSRAEAFKATARLGRSTRSWTGGQRGGANALGKLEAIDEIDEPIDLPGGPRAARRRRPGAMPGRCRSGGIEDATGRRTAGAGILPKALGLRGRAANVAEQLAPPDSSRWFGFDDPYDVTMTMAATSSGDDAAGTAGRRCSPGRRSYRQLACCLRKRSVGAENKLLALSEARSRPRSSS